jgi:3-phenylpropionate/trans-cinnamate dioxygenase ferredoxin reductase component
MPGGPGPDPILIIGAGLTGGKAAVTLREEGFDGRLILLGSEAGLPFGRPPLSKEYLRGEEDLLGWTVKPDSWYSSNQVEILEATAAGVDLARHRVRLSSGESIAFSKLLIATGGRNRRLAAPGTDLPGVYQLRTVAECDAIRAAVGPGAQAVIVGMGFIGCEVAASLRQLGVEVTAVLSGRWPLAAVLGDEVGTVMAGMHTDAGVRLIPNDSVVSISGTDRVEGVTTKAGQRIACDLAILAVGIEPNTEPFADSGLPMDNGVLVDAGCRTAHPDVWAAGDVANHLHPVFGRIRVEHYNNAEKQGVAAARSLLGVGGAYDYIHSFWSDQYQDKLEYVGHAQHWDTFVTRGSLEERRFVGFYLEAGKLKAAVGFNRGGDPEVDADGELARAGTLIAASASVAAKELAEDETVRF